MLAILSLCSGLLLAHTPGRLSLLLMKQQLLRSKRFVGKAHTDVVQVTSGNQARMAYGKNPERLSPIGPRNNGM